jgi:hypothetical protein
MPTSTHEFIVDQKTGQPDWDSSASEPNDSPQHTMVVWPLSNLAASSLWRLLWFLLTVAALVAMVLADSCLWLLASTRPLSCQLVIGATRASKAGVRKAVLRRNICAFANVKFEN